MLWAARILHHVWITHSFKVLVTVSLEVASFNILLLDCAECEQQFCKPPGKVVTNSTLIEGMIWGK